MQKLNRIIYITKRKKEVGVDGEYMKKTMKNEKKKKKKSM